MLKKIVSELVDASGRKPGYVFLITFLFSMLTWGYASKLELRSDFMELLPRDSLGFRAYEHQLGRIHGSASFTFVVESPDRHANEAFIDALAAKLDQQKVEREACLKECRNRSGLECSSCGEEQLMYYEAGSKELRSFFQRYKWLYLPLKDLVQIDQTIDEKIAYSGLVENLEEPEKKKTLKKTGEEEANKRSHDEFSAREEKLVDVNDLGLASYERQIDSEIKKYDDFPTGYFALEDGSRMVLRVVTSASGTGGASGDRFMSRMRELTLKLDPKSFHPNMQVGYAGDIPNALEEKESIMSEAAWATLLAAFFSLAGIVLYFRSLSSLAIVFTPVLVGVGSAYAFATAAFGYVNTAGAFLGAIIIGNGINYPIVLLARYTEFRSYGMPASVARREAVLNAFRAELVGALVAAAAYGSLTVTNFRGFSQFGTIGFFGMLFAWLSILPIVPAMIVFFEDEKKRLPSFLRFKTKIRNKDESSFLLGRVAAVSARHPGLIVFFVLLLVGSSLFGAKAYLKDPWEYDFHRLGSQKTKQGGAGEWSNRADDVFLGKQDISGARMLADDPKQVEELRQKILENDAHDPEGKLISKIITINDFLPGTSAEQKTKLEVIERIYDRLTPRVLASLPEAEKERALRMRPPHDLHIVSERDLPSLIKRRFEENNGQIGTLFYAQYDHKVSQGNGKIALRLAKTMDNIVLSDRTLVQTASRATVYSEMIKAMRHDGPLATLVSFLFVLSVVLLATHTFRGALAVVLSLIAGVVCTLGWAICLGERLNFLNFIAWPITFGIGCEYPFNIYDRSRIFLGDVSKAIKHSGGAVALCSYTTVIGYGSLLVADQQAVASFGRLAVVGEIACVSMALFFLPALLHLLSGRFGEKKIKTVSSSKDT